jgi:hypothetical protein
MDRTKYPLPGVTVTATGAVRREVVSSLDGEYRIADLPPGRYTVTAELAGFLTETQAVDVGAGETRTLDLLLRLGCLGGLDPPLTVSTPHDLMLPQIAGVAYLRIRETGTRERLLTDTSCLSVRAYAEPLALINIAAPQDARVFQFYGRSWDPELAPGDELITFLDREESTGTYHEWDDANRMPIRNGRLNSMQMDWSLVAIGDPVEDVLNKIRAALNRKPPQP